MFGILAAAALTFGTAVPAFAHESPKAETFPVPIKTQFVKPEHPEISLEEAKVKILAMLEKKEAHLKEMLEKIHSNPNLNEEEKERIANGIQKVLDMLAKLKTKVQEAASLKELKRLRHAVHEEMRHLKRMRKHMVHPRLHDVKESDAETVKE